MIDPLELGINQTTTTSDTSDITTKNGLPPLPPRPKSSHGGLIALIVFLLIIGGVAYWRLFIPKETLEAVPIQAVQVYTATVKVEDISVYTVLTGKIRASEDAMVFAPATAEVKNIYVEKGDYVNTGDKLFTLDGTQVEGGYNQAQAARNAAQDGVEMARQNLDRMQALYDGAAIPQSQLEQAENQLTQAENQLRQAEAALNSASSSFGLLSFTAPVAGIVTELNIKEGMYPMQQLPAVTIANLDDLEIAASVSEYLIGHLKEGDAVNYRIDSLGSKLYQGQIKSVALAPATGGVTYPITVTVNATEDNIKPGMFAELSIPSLRKNSVLIAPISSLLTQGGKTLVAVLIGDIPHLQEVEIGINDGERVEIISGLNAGDTVITKGQHYIVEGEAVIRLSE
ncbi:MAG: efflux RND transporter periplasmic adaptor subunit [Firmicutes bacterium]|nr:efflux RND transporter periplasmic adaptor subunit [Bacillota bacterium]